MRRAKAAERKQLRRAQRAEREAAAAKDGAAKVAAALLQLAQAVAAPGGNRRAEASVKAAEAAVAATTASAAPHSDTEPSSSSESEAEAEAKAETTVAAQPAPSSTQSQGQLQSLSQSSQPQPQQGHAMFQSLSLTSLPGAASADSLSSSGDATAAHMLLAPPVAPLTMPMPSPPSVTATPLFVPLQTLPPLTPASGLPIVGVGSAQTQPVASVAGMPMGTAGFSLSALSMPSLATTNTVGSNLATVPVVANAAVVQNSLPLHAPGPLFNIPSTGTSAGTGVSSGTGSNSNPNTITGVGAIAGALANSGNGVASDTGYSLTASSVASSAAAAAAAAGASSAAALAMFAAHMSATPAASPSHGPAVAPASIPALPSNNTTSSTLSAPAAADEAEAALAALHARLAQIDAEEAAAVAAAFAEAEAAAAQTRGEPCAAEAARLAQVAAKVAFRAQTEGALFTHFAEVDDAERAAAETAACVDAAARGEPAPADALAYARAAADAAGVGRRFADGAEGTVIATGRSLGGGSSARADEDSAGGACDFWFDWFADTGDGGDATYTVAWLSAQPYLDLEVPGPLETAAPLPLELLRFRRDREREDRKRGYHGGMPATPAAVAAAAAARAAAAKAAAEAAPNNATLAAAAADAAAAAAAAAEAVPAGYGLGLGRRKLQQQQQQQQLLQQQQQQQQGVRAGTGAKAPVRASLTGGLLHPWSSSAAGAAVAAAAGASAAAVAGRGAWGSPVLPLSTGGPRRAPLQQRQARASGRSGARRVAYGATLSAGAEAAAMAAAVGREREREREGGALDAETGNVFVSTAARPSIVAAAATVTAAAAAAAAAGDVRESASARDEDDEQEQEQEQDASGDQYPSPARDGPASPRGGLAALQMRRSRSSITTPRPSPPATCRGAALAALAASPCSPSPAAADASSSYVALEAEAPATPVTVTETTSTGAQGLFASALARAPAAAAASVKRMLTATRKPLKQLRKRSAAAVRAARRLFAAAAGHPARTGSGAGARMVHPGAGTGADGAAVDAGAGDEGMLREVGDYQYDEDEEEDEFDEDEDDDQHAGDGIDGAGAHADEAGAISADLDAEDALYSNADAEADADAEAAAEAEAEAEAQDELESGSETGDDDSASGDDSDGAVPAETTADSLALPGGNASIPHSATAPAHTGVAVPSVTLTVTAPGDADNGSHRHTGDSNSGAAVRRSPSRSSRARSRTAAASETVGTPDGRRLPSASLSATGGHKSGSSRRSHSITKGPAALLAPSAVTAAASVATPSRPAAGARAPAVGTSSNATTTATTTVASSASRVSRRDLPHVRLPRPRVLVIGGDMAYPTPNAETFDERLLLPFEYALPPPAWRSFASAAVRKPELPRGVTLRAYHGPQAFVLPGNHDWFDGLDTFARYFMHRSWFAGWLLPQTRSYFALRLPCKWWMFAVDLSLTLDIDPAQYQFFADTIEREMGPDDRVIVCTHEPTWLLAWYEGASEPRSLLELIEAKLRGRCVMRVAGDVHHYCRHSAAVADLAEERKDAAAALLEATGALPPLPSATAGATAVAAAAAAAFPDPTSPLSQARAVAADSKTGAAGLNKPLRGARTAAAATAAAEAESARARKLADREAAAGMTFRGWLRRLWRAATLRGWGETDVLETVGAVADAEAEADAVAGANGLGDDDADGDGDGETSPLANATITSEDDDNDEADADAGFTPVNPKSPTAPQQLQQQQQQQQQSKPAQSQEEARRERERTQLRGLTGPRHLIVSGGGGAFLHPTHPFSAPLRGYNGRVYPHARSYPSAEVSRKITFGNLIKFRKKNWRFDVLGGVMYFVLIISVLPLCGLSDYLHAPPLSFIPTFSASVLTSATSTALKHSLSVIKTFTTEAPNAAAAAAAASPAGVAGSGMPPLMATPASTASSAPTVGANEVPEMPTYMSMLNASCPAFPPFLFSPGPHADAAVANAEIGNSGFGVAASALALQRTSPLSLVPAPSPAVPAWALLAPPLTLLYYVILLCARHVTVVVAIVASMVVNGGASLIALAFFSVIIFCFCPSSLPWRRRAPLAAAHLLLHVFFAITLAMIFEVALEVSAKAGLVGKAGLHALYAAYAEQEAMHFPDPNDIRGTIASLTFGLYPACIRWAMTLFDVLEYSAFFRAQVCQACGNFASFSSLATLAYYASFFVYFWVLVTPVFAFIIGCYLYVALNYCNVHWDEGFSSLRISHFKSFLRCRITPQGDLHVFCVGIDRVPKLWRPEPRWRLLPRQIAAIFSRRATAAAAAAAAAAGRGQAGAGSGAGGSCPVAAASAVVAAQAQAKAKASRLQQLRVMASRFIDVTSTVTVKALGAIAGVAVAPRRSPAAASAAAAAAAAAAATAARAAAQQEPQSAEAARAEAAAAAVDALALSSLFDDAHLLAHPEWGASDAAWLRLSFRDAHPSRWRPDELFRPRIVDYFCVRAADLPSSQGTAAAALSQGQQQAPQRFTAAK